MSYQQWKLGGGGGSGTVTLDVSVYNERCAAAFRAGAETMQQLIANFATNKLVPVTAEVVYAMPLPEPGK